MNPNREEALFALALEKTAEKRCAFLDAVCEGDVGLRQRLDALLAAHEQPDELLATKAEAAQPTLKIEVADGAADEAVGQTLGRYKLLERVGEGGCGVVYVAEQTEPVRRRVALKVIKLGMDTKAMVARFEAERQALAMMDHPNIAKVLDAGTTDAGRPYFVMELVRGIKITDYCDQSNLSTKERLDLFIKVCQAIQHAHQKGIIHRDIKPSNILVTLHDGVPVPKVIDFGIAKATEGRLTDATVYTELHQFMGTPAYMSPEQAEMSGLDIDTRSDIYSLGVLLYQLLTSKTPFDAKELLAMGIDAMRKTIREKEPVRPSTRLAALQGEELTATAKRRSADAPKLIYLLRGDLDWIVMKAIEKDRTRRYETANGLATDIQRHLNNEPVIARPPSTAYRVQKAWQRNKLAFATAVTVFAALVTGLGIATWQFMLKKRAQQLAERQLVRMNVLVGGESLRARDDFRSLLWFVEAMSLDPGDTKRETVHRYRIAATLQGAPRLVQMIFHAGPVRSVQFSADGQRLLTASGDQTARIWDLASGRLTTAVIEHPAPLLEACFSPDGRRIATVTENGESRLWDAAKGQPLSPPLMEDVLPAMGGTGKPRIRFSPDGHRLLTTSYSSKLRLRDGSTGEIVRTLEHPSRVVDAEFSADGRLLLTGCTDQYARLWEPASGKLIGTTMRHTRNLKSVGFSSDGRRFFTAARYELRLWETDTVRPLTDSIDLKYVLIDAKFSPDGDHLVTLGWHGYPQIWDGRTGKQLRALPQEGGGEQVAFSPDGALVATVTWAGIARVWDTQSGELRTATLSHSGPLRCVAFSPDGRWLATGAGNGVVQVWELAGRDSIVQMLPHPLVDQAEFSPDGRFVITAGRKKREPVRVWDWATGRLAGPLLSNEDTVIQSRFSPDGTRVLTVASDGAVRIWAWQVGREVGPSFRPEGVINDATFSPDGQRVLTSSSDHTARIWDISTGRQQGPSLEHSDSVATACFSPDGRLVMTGGLDNHARLWSATTGEAVAPPMQHRWKVIKVQFSADGRRVLTLSSKGPRDGSDFGAARIWDVASGRAVTPPMSHSGRVYDAQLSLDGKRVVTGSVDFTARLWDAETGQALAPPLRHGNSVLQTSFSPDGLRLATGSEDGNVRVWDAFTGEPISPPLPHPLERDLMHMRFSPDGDHLVIATTTGTAWIRHLPKTTLPLEDLRAHAQLLSGQRIAGREWVPLTPAVLSNSWQSARAKYPEFFGPSAPISRRPAP